MCFVDKVKALHLSQHYLDKGNKLDMDYICKRYTSLPNETTYVVDCARAEIEFLDNHLSEITGSDITRNTPLAPLYDHVKANHFEMLTKIVWDVVSFGFKTCDTPGLAKEADVIQYIYQTKDGRTILKSTSVLEADPTGKMTYSLGKLTDLTHLVQHHHFRHRCFGPSQELLMAHLNHTSEFTGLLTQREIHILTHIGDGLKSRKIADILHLSIATVNTHRRNINKKLGANGSIEAYNKALDMGLLRF